MAMKKGFTLIELLVVVLIIGILAAVALPQYRIAVAKSHVASYFPALASLRKALDVYYLENNSYPSSLDELALDFAPGNDCELNEHKKSVVCITQPENIRLEYYMSQSKSYVDKEYGKLICWGGIKPNTFKDKVCRSLSGKNTPDTVANNFEINGRAYYLN